MLVASVQSLSVGSDIDVDETKSSGTPDQTFYHPHVCEAAGSDCGVALNDYFALYACRCLCVCVCVCARVRAVCLCMHTDTHRMPQLCSCTAEQK